jgi:hypothetical protein
MFDDPVGGGVAAFLLPPRGLASPLRPGFVVAVPVKDEEERLPACLRALAHQFDPSGRPISPELLRVALLTGAGIGALPGFNLTERRLIGPHEIAFAIDAALRLENAADRQVF